MPSSSRWFLFHYYVGHLVLVLLHSLLNGVLQWKKNWNNFIIASISKVVYTQINIQEYWTSVTNQVLGIRLGCVLLWWRRAQAFVTNLLLYPIQIIDDPRVHSRIIGPGATSTPGHYSCRYRRDMSWKSLNQLTSYLPLMLWENSNTFKEWKLVEESGHMFP
jgi:hypothetical protein